jgi:tRNA threonylcarbamoyl adenosine modification protein (Sua5/YciO/YrdC/YwlC family)
MAIRYILHPSHPQLRSIYTIVDELHHGAIMLYPTDTVYAIGCDISNKNAQERIRKLRNIPEDKPLTFVASSLSNISDYAHISDTAYHILRNLVPGPYTFLLPASKLVPKLVLNPRRKTTGIRVPDNAICQILIHELQAPVISMSAYLPNRPEPESLEELFELFDPFVDIIIDDESEYRSPFVSENLSTMIDLTDDIPEIHREGLGIELARKFL